jgi:hypothetical protein
MDEYTVQIDIPLLLQFFDEKVPDSYYHATSIVAVAGEEMGVGLVIHYLRRTGWAVENLGPCTQGTPKGYRLDRWIRATRGLEIVYFQTEVKNWSAHAIGGKPLKPDVVPDAFAAHKKKKWSDVWDGTTLRGASAKVLVPMKPTFEPEEGSMIEPLISYWNPMHPDGGLEPMFYVPIQHENFARLWVFSMSNYVRELLLQGETTIRLEMPGTVKRMNWLNRLFAQR